MINNTFDYPRSISSTHSNICPCCGSVGMWVFYELNQVPVHSVLLLSSREEAINYPKGDIHLGFCESCGFISNTKFEPELQDYSVKYEATQAYSTTFNIFHDRLARLLIERYDLHGKRIIEIGCGQGEFLSLLCKIGGNQGIGFDPAFVPQRSQVNPQTNIAFIQDFYSDKYSHVSGDFVCCKMTLEHIYKPADFVEMIYRTMSLYPEAILFIQVPNARYVFGEQAFWDVYYEHCSYFSPGSLARLLGRIGFDVVDLWTDYNSQYLMLCARLANNDVHFLHNLEYDFMALKEEVQTFHALAPKQLSSWRNTIQSIQSAGQRLVLWGGGSKAVAFLTALDISLDWIEYIVDINPFKEGTYIASTGQKIVLPEFLTYYKPDVILVMNPVYSEEVQKKLDGLSLNSQILSIESNKGN